MGILEKFKGKAKQAAGDLTGNRDLQAEGEAQEEKGDAELKETKARAKAKGHEAEAKEKEIEQRAAQEAKRR